MKDLKDYKEEIHRCSKCGLCQAVCPIYQETGNECSVSRGQFIMLGGVIKDGKLWGRGTVDTKTPLFAEFSAIEELLEEGFEFPVNVYLFSSHNEEVSGNGALLALDYFNENHIRFDWISDEGGAVIDPPMAGIAKNVP